MDRNQRRKGPASRNETGNACKTCPMNPKTIIDTPRILPKYKRDHDAMMAYRKRKFEEQQEPESD